MSQTSGAAGSGIVTAALLVIGDEILSGRTKDKNIGHIADHLTGIGIQMKEVRVVPDEEPEIVEALNALRSRYDYVRSEEHTSELQSPCNLVCRLLLEK